MNLFTAVYTGKLQRFRYALKRFHSSALSEIAIYEIAEYDMFAGRIAKIRSQLHVGNNVALPFRIQKCKISRIAARRNHGKCRQSRRKERGYAVPKNAISVKGNLLSARLRTHRNSCKSRIDTGQLSKEGDSNGICYILGAPGPTITLFSHAKPKNNGRTFSISRHLHWISTIVKSLFSRAKKIINVNNLIHIYILNFNILITREFFFFQVKKLSIFIKFLYKHSIKIFFYIYNLREKILREYQNFKK